MGWSEAQQQARAKIQRYGKWPTNWWDDREKTKKKKNEVFVPFAATERSTPPQTSEPVCSLPRLWWGRHIQTCPRCSAPSGTGSGPPDWSAGSEDAPRNQRLQEKNWDLIFVYTKKIFLPCMKVIPLKKMNVLPPVNHWRAWPSPSFLQSFLQLTPWTVWRTTQTNSN